MTEFEKYFGNILDGKIIACDKIKRISEILIEQFLNPGEFLLTWILQTEHIEFIERFWQTADGKAGTAAEIGIIPESEIPGYLWICR